MVKYISLLFFLMFSCSISSTLYAQHVNVINMEDLQKMIEKTSEKIHLINFWATWCAPCVKELPVFENIHHTEAEKVKVSLVSLDMDLNPNSDKVRQFVSKKKLKSDVYILNEENPNNWIDKIDKNWSGAIPATLVVNSKTGKRIFVEGELGEEELKKLMERVQ